MINNAKEVRNNIRGEYTIPPLLLDHVSTGFATDELTNAYNYYNNITKADRQLFEEVFYDIMPRFYRDLQSKDIYEIKKLRYITDETTNVQ